MIDYNKLLIFVESTPPESIEDYDLQFKKSISFISSSRDNVDHPIIMLVSDLDFQNDSQLLNTPQRLLKDLTKAQYIVYFLLIYKYITLLLTFIIDIDGVNP